MSLEEEKGKFNMREGKSNSLTTGGGNPYPKRSPAFGKEGKRDAPK